MSYTIQPGDLVLATKVQSYMGQTYMNCQYYRYAGSTSVGLGEVAMDQLAAELSTNPATWMARQFSATVMACRWDETWCQKIWPARFRKSVHVLGLDGPVDDTGVQVNQALSIQKIVEEASKGASGKMQVTAFPVSHISQGKVTAAGLAAWNPVALAISLPVTVGGGGMPFEPVLVGRKTPLNPTVHRVVGGRVMGTARVMRRRTLQIGI